MNISKSLFILAGIFLPAFAFAQETPKLSGFSVAPAFELLRSTHGNAFYAPSVKFNYLFENGLEPGIGVEYSTTPEHHDNGFVLYKLRFVPVYGNLKYNFKSSKKIKPYAEMSLGISFNNYKIADETTPLATASVHEKGFYVYTGFGAKYALSTNINTYLGVGFKGYKMSRNDLDINPHGLSFMLGLNFK